MWSESSSAALTTTAPVAVPPPHLWRAFTSNRYKLSWMSTSRLFSVRKAAQSAREKRS